MRTVFTITALLITLVGLLLYLVVHITENDPIFNHIWQLKELKVLYSSCLLFGFGFWSFDYRNGYTGNLHEGFSTVLFSFLLSFLTFVLLHNIFIFTNIYWPIIILTTSTIVITISCCFSIIKHGLFKK